MEISAQTYQELYIILGNMKKSDVMKIPVNILENIKNKRDTTYVSKIDEKNLLDRENMLPQTIEILAWFDVNYWFPNKKNKLFNDSMQNQIHNLDVDIFKNKNKK